MTTTTKTKNTVTATSAKVKGQTIKAMYKVSEITNRTNKNLWVAFVAGQESTGMVFSMVWSRDQVRNIMSKITGTSIQSIRSQRVSNFRKNA